MRPGRSPCAASPLRPGRAQPRRALPFLSAPLRSAAAAAPPRCGWGPRRCCWPARCGSRSGPTPSSCSSAGGDTAKGAASRVRRGGAEGRLRPGPARWPRGRRCAGREGGSGLQPRCCVPAGPGPVGEAEGPPRDRGAGPVRAGRTLPASVWRRLRGRSGDGGWDRGRRGGNAAVRPPQRCCRTGRANNCNGGGWGGRLPSSKMASLSYSCCLELLRCFLWGLGFFFGVSFQGLEDERKT